MIKSLKTFFSGFIVGSSMTVPGLSGGTMAIILGIYDKLIHAVGTITTKKGFKKNVGFLITFLIGSGAGIFILSGIIDKAIDAYQKPMLYLFIGIIAGTIPTLIKETGAKSIKIADILFMIFGFVICFLISLIPNDLVKFSEGFSFTNLLIIIAAGFIIAIALVLPGISCSQMLLLLGILDITYKAINTFNLAFLIPLALSVGIGILLTTNILDRFMKNYPRGTYFLISGFVIGSVLDIFKDMPNRTEFNFIYVLMLIAGIIIITIFSRFARKYTAIKETEDIGKTDDSQDI